MIGLFNPHIKETRNLGILESRNPTSTSMYILRFYDFLFPLISVNGISIKFGMWEGLI